MADAVVNIGAVVDKAAIVSGMDESSQGVNAATTKMATYFNGLQSSASNSWKKIAEDTRTAAASVSAESLRIANASKAVTAAMIEQRAAVNLTKNAHVDAAISTSVLAAAQDKARVAAAELAAANKAVEVTSHGSVSGVQATSAAIRSLEGNAGIRAVENFVSKTLGLGPAMQALFPYIGAAAFGMIVFDIGEKLVEMEKKGKAAAAAIASAFGDLHDRALITSDDLRIQDDKLKDEIAKLSGSPGTGLQTALDEAIKRADQLLVALRADQKAAQAIFKENSVSLPASYLSGTAATGQQEKEITADGKKLQEAVRAANQKYVAELMDSKTPEAQKAAGDRQAQAIRSAFQSNIDAYTKEVARLAAEDEAAKKAGVANAFQNNSAKIANLQGVIGSLQDRLEQEKLGQNVEADQKTVGQMKGDKQPKEKKDNADEEELRGIEADFAKLKAARESLTGKPLTAGEAASFWAQYLTTFKDGSTQATKILNEFSTAQGAIHSQLTATMKKSTEKDAADPAEQEKVARAIDEMNKRVVEQAEDITRTGARWDGYNKAIASGAEIMAKQNEQMQELRIKAEESTGMLRPLAAAQQLAGLHAAEHAAKVKALREELEKLRAEGANLKPGDKGYEENQTRQQTAQNAISTEQGAGQVQAAQDTQAIQNAMAKPYLSAFDQINNGWLKVQNDLIMGQGNVGRNFEKMAAGLVVSMAQSAEKMIANNLRREILQRAQHQATVASNTAVDAAGAATSVQTSMLAALKKQAHAAANAAGKAYVAMADIPIVGPELGAVAAAATYAGVMALAAFEKGGIVGGSPGMGVPILAHAGERVLTTSQTNNFERMVNNSQSSSSGDTNHYHLGGNTIHGGGKDAPTINDRQFIAQHRRLSRQGRMAPARRSILE